MISQFKSKVGTLAKKFGRFKKQKTLKMKVSEALGSAKYKAKKTAKYIKKNPIKSAAIGTGVAGLSYLGYKDFSNKNKKMQKRLISEFKKLPKSDPRYKSLKKAGYI